MPQSPGHMQHTYYLILVRDCASEFPLVHMSHSWMVGSSQTIVLTRTLRKQWAQARSGLSIRGLYWKSDFESMENVVTASCPPPHGSR
ncbi:hypothetical protein SCLCIDRAFT_171153 [Scleroderma citrinum Foug A]|uniref:Uncharacterized protein n=1 Tax=Scleroderma citrinum Foug A TaxID=1036808 RepID=A0A0C3ERR7_9AGAM|nr:hypothetical protein SCLCIDRAFT_171153 [Scleroderma citrinum Foug A]